MIFRVFKTIDFNFIWLLFNLFSQKSVNFNIGHILATQTQHENNYQFIDQKRCIINQGVSMIYELNAPHRLVWSGRYLAASCPCCSPHEEECCRESWLTVCFTVGLSSAWAHNILISHLLEQHSYSLILQRGQGAVHHAH